jgi:hypothetical protein
VKGFAVVGVSLAVAAAACSLSRGPESDFTLDEVRDRPGPAPYFVGEKFEELPLTAIVGDVGRLTFVYGDCDPEGGDGGCAPPLEVQVWPIGRRPPGVISAMIDCQRVTVRGAPGAFFGGPDLDLYVGDYTIVIFAESREQARRAAEALRPVDAAGPDSGDLPAPKLHADTALERCAAA